MFLFCICNIIYFTSKTKRNEAILKYKEDKYSNLLVLLQGFVGLTASSETKKKFFEEQHRSWLYCSAGVVTAINDMIELAISEKVKIRNQKKEEESLGTSYSKCGRIYWGKLN